MELGKRPVGEWYSVQMRTPEYSLAKAGLSRKGTFPVPDMGKLCICCDKETIGIRAIVPSSGAAMGTPVKVPMCDACKEHVPRVDFGEMGAAMGALCGVGAIVVGLVQAIVVVAVIGAVVVCGCLGWFALRKHRRLVRARNGHFSGIEIVALPEMCRIRTTNPRFAAELVERNRDMVFSAS
jgi:hypothetical protein